MNKFWLTLFLVLTVTLNNFAWKEEPSIVKKPKEIPQEEKKFKSEKSSLKDPEILNLRSDLQENELLLSWTIPNHKNLSFISVEKITNEKTVELARIEINGDLFAREYSLPDLLDEEEFELEIIIYRITGYDSAGVAITEKQLSFNPNYEFKGYDLFQNFPNPFNPLTTIKYQVPVSQFVTLKVFNILGNQVAVLIEETKPAGTHEIEFDATGLTSGVYLYTIQIGKFTETKRMILMK